ncbi:MAG: WbqC family protein [Prevotellaceae bacterium]|jgi:hypothetical protein|nr:WbqC family protein [Prevotellaceae bacterium]
MQTDEVYLSTAYFGNIQYFSKFVAFQKVHIEQHENYIKQSFRNRCEILTANGKLALVIPVERNAGNKILIRDVCISYAQPWQNSHWRALETAYNSSPFFEYYFNDLKPFFTYKEKFLFDFNTKITNKILELLEINKELFFTEKYKVCDNDFMFDCRNSISPKTAWQKRDLTFAPQKYYQVFAQKFGFTANLSIIDLLFNEGTNAKEELTKCIIRCGNIV